MGAWRGMAALSVAVGTLSPLCASAKPIPGENGHAGTRQWEITSPAVAGELAA